MERRTTSNDLVACAIIFLFTTIFSANIAYGQQLSSSRLGTSPITPVSAKIRSEMCDPGNPSLKVVNTTESRICGIPKTVKNTTTTAASSSSPPASVAAGVATPNQQQTVNTKNNKVVSGSNDFPIPRTTTVVSESSNKSLSAPSKIAPQANAINNQLKHAVATSNTTVRDNYTFPTTTPAGATGKLMYLGYHGTPAKSDSTSKEKDSSHSKSVSHDTSSSSSSSSDSTSKEKDSSHSKDTKRTSDSDTQKEKDISGKHSNDFGRKIEGILKEVL
jgi:hypothetical protein